MLVMIVKFRRILLQQTFLNETGYVIGRPIQQMLLSSPPATMPRNVRFPETSYAEINLI